MPNKLVTLQQNESIANAVISKVKNKGYALATDIAPVETSPTTSAHATGDLIIYNGELYKAKTDIAVGATLTVNTNIEATTVADSIETGGSGITVDDALSTISTNPVQNKVITQTINDITKMLFPKLTITSRANASYTATCNGKEIAGTIGSNGTAETYLSELGTWTVTVSDSHGTKSATVSASSMGTAYSATITFATLTVTSDTGNTITATNGNYTVSGTATGGTCNLELGVGTWSLTATDGTLSVSDSVTINTSTTTTSKTLKFPTLTVTSDSGNSISATDGTRTVTGTATGGSCVLKVIPGTWTVTTTNGTVSATSASTSVSAHSTNYNVSILLPYITLTGDVGNTVTATKGTTVVSGTVTSGGTCVLKVEVGTWTVKSTSSSNSNIYVSDTVSVSTNGINYPITMKLPTITVTTAASASVSATKSGVTVSGTANSSGVCVLKVAVGTWSVSATSGGSTKTSSATLSAHSTNVNVSIEFLNAWQVIQQKVRNGTAATEYPVGTQLQVTKGNTTLTFDVVAHDVATPTDTTKTHSMTLVLHDLLPDYMMFDNAEPNNSDSNRKSYGNNRYSVSNIRQWLNSSGAAGSWYSNQHTADAAPDYASTKAGFMNDIDSDFLGVIGQTKIRVAKNTVTDGGGYEDINDKFYLPSTTEVGLANENNIAEGALFPYFDSNNKRIKSKAGGSAYDWWLRTPYSGNSYYARGVNAGGSRSNGFAYFAYGVAPACNII